MNVEYDESEILSRLVSGMEGHQGGLARFVRSMLLSDVKIVSCRRMEFRSRPGTYSSTCSEIVFSIILFLPNLVTSVTFLDL